MFTRRGILLSSGAGIFATRASDGRADGSETTGSSTSKLAFDNTYVEQLLGSNNEYYSEDLANNIADFPSDTAAPESEAFTADYRSPDDQGLFEKAKTEFQNICDDIDSVRRGVIPSKFRSITMKIPEIRNSQKAKASNTFNTFQVEAMIDQAADLLDRAIMDRAAWDGMSAKYVELCLELTEFFKLDEIHKMEFDAGYYTKEAAVANGEYRHIQKEVSSKKEQAQGHVNLYQEFFSEKSKISNLNQLGKQAFASSYHLKDQGFGYPGGEYTNTVNHMVSAVNAIGRRDLNLNSETLKLKQNDITNSGWAMSHLVRGKRKVSDWEEKNIRFAYERMITARNRQEVRLQLAKDADGVLNHAKYLDALSERFNDDIQEALARMRTAEVSLKEIFDYDSPIEDKVNVESGQECLDAYITWTRKTIQWLNRFGSSDQGVTIPLSIRNAVGNSKFSSMKKRGVFELETEDLFGAPFFKSMHYPRMRGVSVFTEGVPDFSVSYEITPPPDALIFSENNPEGRTIENINVSPLFALGTVKSDSMRGPETLGRSVLHNSSPFGKWELKIVSKHDQKFFKDDSINDVILNVSLIYKRK